MANEIKTRIQLKYDSYANWTTHDPVLLKGEIAIAELAATNAQVQNGPNAEPQHPILFKVGNGTAKFSALPWASALAADVYAWAKQSENDFVTNFLALKTTDGTTMQAKLDAVFATDAELSAAIAELRKEIPTQLGVMSVTEKQNTAIEVDNTDAANPKIGLKLNNAGNVVLTQDSDGLAANVDIPDLDGGKAAGNDAKVVGGVTVNGHTVTVGEKEIKKAENSVITVTGGTDAITIGADLSGYKTKQEVVEKNFEGVEVVSNITQDENGKLSITSHALPNAGTDLGVIKSGGVATIVGGQITEISKASEADHATNADNAANATTAEMAETAKKVEQSLTISVAGTQKAVFNGAAAAEVDITAADLGLASAMHFVGALTEAPESAQPGDVYLNTANKKEYVYDTTHGWVELGDEGSHALKTITITGTDGLTGGGSLEQNRTIGIADGGVSAAKLAKNAVTLGAEAATTGTYAGEGVNLVLSTDETPVTIASGTNVTVSYETGVSENEDIIVISAIDTKGKNVVGAAATATANAAATNGNVYLNHVEGSTVVSAHNIKGANEISVESDANGNITVDVNLDDYAKKTDLITDTNTEYNLFVGGDDAHGNEALDNPHLVLFNTTGDEVVADHQISGSKGTTVKSDANGNITIETDLGAYATTEYVDNQIDNLHAIATSGSIYDVTEGHNVSVGIDDANAKYLVFNCGSATEVI